MPGKSIYDRGMFQDSAAAVEALYRAGRAAFLERRLREVQSLGRILDPALFGAGFAVGWRPWPF
jgi:hypothetical protein